MRILVSCANGSGTSLMMMKTVEKAMKAMEFKINHIEHCAISEGKSTAKNYDVVFTPLNFVNMFDRARDQGVTVIGVKNVMSADEITKRVQESDLPQKFLKK